MICSLRPSALIGSVLCLTLLAACSDQSSAPSDDSGYRAEWYNGYQNSWGGGGWGRNATISPEAGGDGETDVADPDMGPTPGEFGIGTSEF